MPTKKMWKILQVKEMLSEKPKFSVTKSAVENRLRLPKHKYSVRDAAA